MSRSLTGTAQLFGICLLGTTLSGCAGDDHSSQTPVQQESPADEVLRIGSTWVSTAGDQKILSPPSALSMQRSQRTSTLSVTRTTVHEDLVIEEDIELRAGGHVHCKTTFSHDLSARWGRRNGEPGVELVRPALGGARSCDGPHPEPTYTEPARRALLLLRSDQLQVVEPTTDRRHYIPQAY
ncbi:MAG TPA: hypothetical protein VLC09_18215 [Polyangiaceae bacterium]|nr:hypothetical protein [Polyangiaceae bacterium]